MIAFLLLRSPAQGRAGEETSVCGLPSERQRCGLKALRTIAQDGNKPKPSAVFLQHLENTALQLLLFVAENVDKDSVIIKNEGSS